MDSEASLRVATALLWLSARAARRWRASGQTSRRGIRVCLHALASSAQSLPFIVMTPTCGGKITTVPVG